MMAQVFIIADDLTGAADTGAAFVRAGLTTLVNLRPGLPPASDVLVISTDSRHLVEEEATIRVRQAAETVSGLLEEGPWVYKKIDSTLRGHARLELAELMVGLGIRRALIAPAFPDQNRTTIDGQQLVGGVPLEDTPFGSEAPSSDLLALFDPSRSGLGAALIDLETVRAGVDLVVEALMVPDVGVYVADAETDEDMSILVRAAVAAEVPLLCGSAGLASALSRELRLVAREPVPRLSDSVEGPVLTIAGSRHAVTTRQVEHAVLVGAWTIRPDGITEGCWADQSRGFVTEAGHILSRGQDAIITTLGMDESPGSGREVAVRLARAARELVLRGQVGGLVLTGGDVAMAFCDALGATSLWLNGEVEPGVPWGRLLDGEKPGLPVVTKAGGFGTPQTLMRAIRHLKRVGAPEATG